ncbi:3-deoxy-D-manno-octulosonic acid kinase [Pseudoalteromonas sp. XMcav1-K]|uniref:3-deoxy-D-manno-octulosonic acid kinase n=1 Tax=Pseudoalteromonas sp. XMcav1-K TaxID=3374372 RepID=UPI0037563149
MLSFQKHGSATIITPSNLEGTFDPNLFDVEYLSRNDLISAKKRGRATTYFFDCGNTTGVLRHYWRGGLIGKLLSDQYLYLGFEKTRTYQEFKLLVELEGIGLPVPKPIAAKVVKSGLIYRGDIITEALPHSQSLLDILKTRSISQKELADCAKTIADFHNHGVNHADLNINNILISDGRVFLIDFDRGTRAAFNPQEAQSNITRLKRSFDKEANRNAQFYWLEKDWKVFIEVYNSALKTA